MFRRCVILLGLFALSLPFRGAASQGGCPAGTPLIRFQLAVQPPGGTGVPLSIRSINLLQRGQEIVYSPVSSRPGRTEKGKVALILVPSDRQHKLAVLKPRPAKATAAWKAPFRSSVIALVYGPSGLDAGKISSLVANDRQLVIQLADYAEQTAKTEKLIHALSAWDRSPSATENLNAALRGFSGVYGRSLPRLDRNAPPEQQINTLLRALNPALAAYDPLGSEPRRRIGQSAMLASSVAGLFFGTPVGLAAGGAALFVNLGSLLFPNTDFRSAFVQPEAPNGLALCAQRGRPKSRTRLAYLWAVRVPDREAPAAAVVAPAHLPLGAVAPVRLRLGKPDDWNYLGGARDWRLRPAAGGKAIPVPVTPVPGKKRLRVDLRKLQAVPGAYRLAATWDWAPLAVRGTLHLHRIDTATPQLTPESADRLITGQGVATVELTGADFEFVQKVTLRGAAGTGSPALSFQLPKGSGAGPQRRLSVRIDTSRLAPGRYRLGLSLPDGTVREVPVRVLPPNPRLSGLPLRVNLGERQQRIRLAGTGLERIEQLHCRHAHIELVGRRAAVVRLQPGVREGDRLDVWMKVEGLHAPLRIPGALRVAGPRPRFEQVRASLPGGLGIALAQGELPADGVVNFALRLKRSHSPLTLHLGCTEKALELRSEAVRVGEQRGGVRLWNAGDKMLFLSLDPGEVGRAGCTLTAVASTEAEGASDPRPLGKVVRLPRIESFELTGQRAGPDRYIGFLQGEDLELIARVGWDANTGVPVNDLPVPVAGGGHREKLRITLPWPSPVPHAPLYVWLRGETTGRATRIRY